MGFFKKLFGIGNNDSRDTNHERTYPEHRGTSNTHAFLGLLDVDMFLGFTSIEGLDKSLPSIYYRVVNPDLAGSKSKIISDTIYVHMEIHKMQELLFSEMDDDGYEEDVTYGTISKDEFEYPEGILFKKTETLSRSLAFCMTRKKTRYGIDFDCEFATPFFNVNISYAVSEYDSNPYSIAWSEYVSMCTSAHLSSQFEMLLVPEKAWILPPSPSLQIEGNAVVGYKGGSQAIVRIPDGITKISDSVFSNHFELMGVYIPESVRVIGENVFQDSGLVSLCLPRDICIGNSAFTGCEFLGFIRPTDGSGNTSDRIAIPPRSIGEIGANAFDMCVNLKKVHLPSGIGKIGDSAFDYCQALEDIVIPTGLRRIGAKAFSCCKSLHQVTTATDPSEVCNNFGLTIGIEAFKYCDKLRQVILPDTAIIVSDSAFYGCNNLLEFGLSPMANSKNSKDDFSSRKSEGSIVGSVGQRAFYDCSQLTRVALPNKTESIGADAFSGCAALTDVLFPSALVDIGSSAFSRCKSLQEVKISAGQTINGTAGLLSIGAEAFWYCSSLKRVEIEKLVSEIGNSAFANCSSLLEFRLSDAKVIGDNVFRGCGEINFTVTPGSSLEAYGAAANMDAAKEAKKAATNEKRREARVQKKAAEQAKNIPAASTPTPTPKKAISSDNKASETSVPPQSFTATSASEPGIYSQLATYRCNLDSYSDPVPGKISGASVKAVKEGGVTRIIVEGKWSMVLPAGYACTTDFSRFNQDGEGNSPLCVLYSGAPVAEEYTESQKIIVGHIPGFRTPSMDTARLFFRLGHTEDEEDGTQTDHAILFETPDMVVGIMIMTEKKELPGITLGIRVTIEGDDSSDADSSYSEHALPQYIDVTTTTIMIVMPNGYSCILKNAGMDAADDGSLIGPIDMQRIALGIEPVSKAWKIPPPNQVRLPDGVYQFGEEHTLQKLRLAIPKGMRATTKSKDIHHGGPSDKRLMIGYVPMPGKNPLELGPFFWDASMYGVVVQDTTQDIGSFLLTEDWEKCKQLVARQAMGSLVASRSEAYSFLAVKLMKPINWKDGDEDTEAHNAFNIIILSKAGFAYNVQWQFQGEVDGREYFDFILKALEHTKVIP